jgi:hypothetical protein
MDDLSEVKDRLIKPAIETMHKHEDAAFRNPGDGTIESDQSLLLGDDVRLECQELDRGMTRNPARPLHLAYSARAFRGRNSDVGEGQA